MNDWEIGPALALAQLQAAIARADQGLRQRARALLPHRAAGLYRDGSRRLGAGRDRPGKPCASIVDRMLVMHPAEDASMVLQTGIPRWGDWIAASGAILGPRHRLRHGPRRRLEAGGR